MAKDVEEGKVCAILSYLLVGIIWYFADDKMRKNNFAKFHAKQGLILLIVSIILSIVVSIFSAIFTPLLFMGGGLGIFWIISLIWYAVSLVLFVLWLIGIIAAATGKEKALPIIGGFAKSLKF
jgi:uncharacterized membrane protein